MHGNRLFCAEAGFIRLCDGESQACFPADNFLPLGMADDILRHERAQRYDRQSLGANVGQDGFDQLFADAPAFVPLGDESVRESDALRTADVFDQGRIAVQIELVTRFGGVIDEGVFVFHRLNVGIGCRKNLQKSYICIR